jgi:hypothetical protein
MDWGIHKEKLGPRSKEGQNLQISRKILPIISLKPRLLAFACTKTSIKSTCLWNRSKLHRPTRTQRWPISLLNVRRPQRPVHRLGTLPQCWNPSRDPAGLWSSDNWKDRRSRERGSLLEHRHRWYQEHAGCFRCRFCYYEWTSSSDSEGTRWFEHPSSRTHPLLLRASLASCGQLSERKPLQLRSSMLWLTLFDRSNPWT